MAKTLIYFDENKFEHEIDKHEMYLEEASNIVSLYNTLNLNSLSSTAEFNLLVNDPKTLIANKMLADKNLSLAGLTMNSAKAFELFDKPAGSDALIAHVEEMKQKYQWAWNVNNYTLTAGAIELSTAVRTRVEESCKFYAQNAKQLEIYNLLKSFVDQANTLQVFQKYQYDFLGSLLLSVEQKVHGLNTSYGFDMAQLAKVLNELKFK